MTSAGNKRVKISVPPSKETITVVVEFDDVAAAQQVPADETLRGKYVNIGFASMTSAEVTTEVKAVLGTTLVSGIYDRLTGVSAPAQLDPTCALSPDSIPPNGGAGLRRAYDLGRNVVQDPPEDCDDKRTYITTMLASYLSNLCVAAFLETHAKKKPILNDYLILCKNLTTFFLAGYAPRMLYWYLPDVPKETMSEREACLHASYEAAKLMDDIEAQTRKILICKLSAAAKSSNASQHLTPS